MIPFIKINNRKIGEFYNPLIIAEIGINHGGKIEKAYQMIDDAQRAGCECVKFQYHIYQEEMIKNKQIPGNANRSIWEIIKGVSLNEEEEIKIKKYVEKKKLIYLSTPFSKKAAERLYDMGVKWFKIGSGECSNTPLIEYISKFNLPIILSTGMNNYKNIKESVDIIRKRKIPFAVMQCTSMYPTPYSKINLNVLKKYKKIFPDAVIGLSDHSIGNYASFASIPLGARIIERHFTSNKNWKGEDISISLDPKELKDLVNGSKNIHEALGNYNKNIKEEEVTKKFAFSTVVAIKDIYVGQKISTKNCWVKRPGTGTISAKNFKKILGRVAKINIKKDTQISMLMLK